VSQLRRSFRHSNVVRHLPSEVELVASMASHRELHSAVASCVPFLFGASASVFYATSRKLHRRTRTEVLCRDVELCFHCCLSTNRGEYFRTLTRLCRKLESSIIYQAQKNTRQDGIHRKSLIQAVLLTASRVENWRNFKQCLEIDSIATNLLFRSLQKPDRNVCIERIFLQSFYLIPTTHAFLLHHRAKQDLPAGQNQRWI
jgi:hypothetical protein